MDRFDHVADEGVRAYLTSPPDDDFNVAARQLAHANRCMMVDGQNRLLPLKVLEKRFQYYEDATNYYGFLNLAGVHESLRKFWSV